MAQGRDLTGDPQQAQAAADHFSRLHDLTTQLHLDLKTQLEVKAIKKQLSANLAEMVIYFAFLGVFTAVVLGTRDPIYSFRFNQAMKDKFVFREFPSPTIYKNFYDVFTNAEFWEYVREVWAPQLFNQDSFGFGTGYVYGQNVVIGTPRWRQIRVKQGVACEPASEFRSVYGRDDCWAQYRASTVSKTPFGPNGTWTFSTSSQLESGPQIAGLQVFEGGGFAEYFPVSLPLPDHIAHIDYLEENGWVDLATRVVFIDFTTYNGNLNLFHIAQLSVEMLPCGGMWPVATFRTARFIKYTRGTEGTIQFALEIILLLFALGYLVQECLEMYEFGLWRYMQSGWNMVDLINSLLFIAAGAVRIGVVAGLAKIDFDPLDTTNFYDFQTISILNTTENNILATNAMLLWFKVYKHTAILPSMAVVAKTVGRSLKNTAGFVVIVLLVLFGFAQAGVLLWGNDVFAYRTFIDAFYTLLRLLLGDFDFFDMKLSNRVLGPMYFIAYVCLVNWIMLSMFLAILGEAYAEVAFERAAFEAEHLTIVSVFKLWLARKSHSMRNHLDRLHKTTARMNVIREADGNDDDVLDMDELRYIFERYRTQAERVMGITSVEGLMAEFDLDHNNVLDKKEQERLLVELERWAVEAESKHGVHAMTNDDDVDSAAVNAAYHRLAHKSVQFRIPEDHSVFLSRVKVDLIMFYRMLNDIEAQMAAVMATMGLKPADKASK